MLFRKAIDGLASANVSQTGYFRECGLESHIQMALGSAFGTTGPETADQAVEPTYVANPHAPDRGSVRRDVCEYNRKCFEPARKRSPRSSAIETKAGRTLDTHAGLLVSYTPIEG